MKGYIDDECIQCDEYIKPYGLKTSPDQKYLFWYDTQQNRLFRYDIEKSQIKMALVNIKGKIGDLSVDQKTVYLSAVVISNNPENPRIISFDYELNEKERFALPEKIPERFFPPIGLMKVFRNQFYVSSLNSNTIYILNKDFTTAGKIEFKGIPKGYDVVNIWFWGESILARFRDRSGPEGPTIVRKHIFISFDREGNCRTPNLIDDKGGTGRDERLGNQTEEGYFINHLPIENIQEKILDNDPKYDKLNAKLRKMIIDSKLGDNPIIKIYWVK